jgi:septal ring factor EnvC (AmiA/AmiB activator)
VMRGRLEREMFAPTLGLPAGPPARRADRGSSRRRQADLARREIERLRRELDDAAGRERRMRESVERTTETLRQEKARLSEARREAAALRRQLKTAERKGNG